jgi:hypothetical protein
VVFPRVNLDRRPAEALDGRRREPGKDQIDQHLDRDTVREEHRLDAAVRAA